MARTLNEIDQAVATLELYLGDQALYTVYGNTLAEALDQYANPIYHEVMADDLAPGEMIQADAVITLLWKGSDINNIYPNTQFIIMPKHNHPAVIPLGGTTAVVKLIKVNGSNEITESKTYEIKVYDTDLSLRNTVEGDYIKGRNYSLYFNGTSFVMTAYDQAQVLSDIGELKNFKDTVTSNLSVVSDELRSALPLRPTEYLGDAMNLTKIGSHSMKFLENKIEFVTFGSAVVDFSAANLKVESFVATVPDDGAHDDKPIPWGLYKLDVDSRVDTAIDQKLIYDTLTPEEYEAANGTLPNGTFYYQVASI